MVGRACPKLTCPDLTPVKHLPRKDVVLLRPPPCPRPRSTDSVTAVEMQSGYKLLIPAAQSFYTHFPLTTGLGASQWVTKLSVFLIHNVVASLSLGNAGRQVAFLRGMDQVRLLGPLLSPGSETGLKPWQTEVFGYVFFFLHNFFAFLFPAAPICGAVIMHLKSHSNR